MTDEGDSVERFLDDLRTLKERSGLTYEQMAKRGQVGRSTVHAAIAENQTQLPSVATVQAFVRATVPPPEQSLAMNEAVAGPTSKAGGHHQQEARPAPSDHERCRSRPQDEQKESRLRQRLKPASLPVVATALVLLAAGFTLGRLTSPEPAVTPQAGSQGPSLTLTQAAVANTAGLGVFTYRQPTNKSKKMSSLKDGDEVYVICLNLDGEPIKDDGLKMTRTVWALLTDGSWIPDLYLNLDKSWAPPSEPPAPMLTC